MRFENIIWHINIRPTVEVIVTGCVSWAIEIPRVVLHARGWALHDVFQYDPPICSVCLFRSTDSTLKPALVSFGAKDRPIKKVTSDEDTEM